MLHEELFDSVEQCRVEIARQQAEFGGKRAAAVEVVVETVEE